MRRFVFRSRSKASGSIRSAVILTATLFVHPPRAEAAPDAPQVHSPRAEAAPAATHVHSAVKRHTKEPAPPASKGADDGGGASPKNAPAPQAPAPQAPAPQAPAPQAPAPQAPAPQQRAPDVVEGRPTGTVGRSLLEFEVGGAAVGRTFDYADGLSQNLRPYHVAPAAMISASAAVFPFAAAPNILSDIGLTASYGRSLFLQSSFADGGTVGTTASSYSIGLRVRFRPWGDGGPLFNVSDEYADQSFLFDAAPAAANAQVPSVDYRANRTAVDVRFPIGSWALLAGAGFRAVLSAGDVASRFRSTSGAGIDAELGAAVPIVKSWEARLIFDYERYFYTFKPIPGDAYVAGGALDQFLSGRLAAAYIF